MNHQDPTNSKQQHKQAPPTFNGGDWNQDEHQLFLTGLGLFKKNWIQIAQVVVTRSVSQIRSHAQKYFKRLESNKEKIGAQPVEVRGQNDVAITRSKTRQSSQLKNSEDSHSNPEKTKKIRKDSDRPTKRDNITEAKKMKKQKVGPSLPTCPRFHIPSPVSPFYHPEIPISNQPERSFYYYQVCGQQLIISPKCSFSPYSSQTNSSENPPAEMTIIYDIK